MIRESVEALASATNRLNYHKLEIKSRLQVSTLYAIFWQIVYHWHIRFKKLLNSNFFRKKITRNTIENSILKNWKKSFYKLKNILTYNVDVQDNNVLIKIRLKSETRSWNEYFYCWIFTIYLRWSRKNCYGRHSGSWIFLGKSR